MKPAILGLLLFTGGLLPAAAPYQLIAHRGGVVEDKFPDNSAAALQAAVARGYRAVEVDIRETKDGVLVMQHDPDLQLNFGDPRRIFECTWEELRPLRTTRGGQPLWTFEDVVKAARAAGLRLMLDPKAPHSPGFAGKVEAVLVEHDMLASCYVIGTADVMDRLTGRARVGKKFRSLRPLLEADPAAREKYFLFEEGRTLTAEMVQWAQARGIPVVPSINTYHYYDPATMAGKSREEIAPVILAAARRHVEQFQALGLTEFQIDSEFDSWF
ncbi:MAG TPA: glycerophosphodiester phosphodiesterase family protein [Lacunisphaera sp.]|nr:glycerophosphodiester phosphodiesterase family protein [Lacunisphaera sp.]